MKVYRLDGDFPVDSQGSQLNQGDAVKLNHPVPNPVFPDETLPAGTKFKCIWYWYGQRSTAGNISPSLNEVEVVWSYSKDNKVTFFNLVVKTENLTKI